MDVGIARSLAAHKPENVVLQIQGSLVLAKGTDDTAPFKRILPGFPDELLKS